MNGGMRCVEGRQTSFTAVLPRDAYAIACYIMLWPVVSVGCPSQASVSRRLNAGQQSGLGLYSFL